MYDIILYFYKIGTYSDKDVEKFVLSGQITEEEYSKITNKEGED